MKLHLDKNVKNIYYNNNKNKYSLNKRNKRWINYKNRSKPKVSNLLAYYMDVNQPYKYIDIHM